jgi:threonylcarbamoyladenosine tRNA methylthiotransferase MtaB
VTTHAAASPVRPIRPVSTVRRAAIANLGCKVNLAEMGAVERLLRSHGIELVDAAEPADLVVVNTCAVTAVADRKSRQTVRRARRANPEARLLVTGCSATVAPGPMVAADPAARLYDNESKDRLLADLEKLLGSASVVAAGALEPGPGPGSAPGPGPGSATGPGSALGHRPDPGETRPDRTRAFVKIGDGCSFGCTYCIIPRARGEGRSVAVEVVLEDVRRAVLAGRREVVLTGINIGTYSDAGCDLAGLVRLLLRNTSTERIRLSSIEPQHVTDELLDVWAESGGRCLPHFHVPLQSGDDAILRRMARRYDTAFYAGMVERIHGALPGAAVHADLIAGFPGEDDDSWLRTAAFIRSLDLAGLHVFRYSARPGTPAARMAGQVDPNAEKRRASEALALAAEARARFAERQIGSEVHVLFEGQLPDGRWLGHAESHVLVAVAAPDGQPLHNVIARVVAASIDPSAPDLISGRLPAADATQLPLAPAAAK